MPSHPQDSSRFSVFFIWLLLTLFAGSPGAMAKSAPVAMEASSLWTEVAVDVTGESKDDAKEQGIKQAQQEAMMSLLMKLNPEQARLIYKHLDPARLPAMVQKIEPLEEHRIGNRYWAKLRVYFYDQAVDQLMALALRTEDAKGVPLRRATIILPLYQESGQTQLWEEKNPWKQAWVNASFEVGRGNLIVPYGDVTDSSNVSAFSIQGIKRKEIHPLLLRYGAGAAVIVRANYRPDEAKTIRVTVRRLGVTKDELSDQTYQGDITESKEALFARVARDISNQLLERQAEDLAVQERATDGGKAIDVTTPIRTLKDWTTLRDRLQAISSVQRIEPVRMDAREVKYRIITKITPDALALQLQNLKIRVTKAQSNTGMPWTILP